MMEIKDIPHDKLRSPKFQIEWDELSANIIDDGRLFCAVSYDSQYCCTGVIVNWRNNLENKNPLLQVNNIFKARD